MASVGPTTDQPPAPTPKDTDAIPADTTRTRKPPTTIELVQIEGLVALKIIKHCEEIAEDQAHDVVQGVLLGMPIEKRLEVTNCFPVPKANAEQYIDENRAYLYQMNMMKNLRSVNVDHVQVGWYQSTSYGAFLNKSLLESQQQYQTRIAEAVVLIYDPTKTARGELSIRAFRLSKKLKGKVLNEYTINSVKAHAMSFEKIFEELPVVIKNSHLMNIGLCEMEKNLVSDRSHNFLDMATGNGMENYLRLLSDTVDELAQDTNRFVGYQKTYSKAIREKDTLITKRHLENQARIARGEHPISDRDIHKSFNLPTPANRLDGLLLSAQVNNLATEMSQLASQNVGKLFMADSLNATDHSINN